jgi:hypothetical protein
MQVVFYNNRKYFTISYEHLKLKRFRFVRLVAASTLREPSHVGLAQEVFLIYVPEYASYLRTQSF